MKRATIIALGVVLVLALALPFVLPARAQKLMPPARTMALDVAGDPSSWITANQVTLAWDAAPQVQATDSPNKYQVWTKFGTSAATPQKVGVETTTLTQPITFSAEGRYILCVQTVRYPAGETVGVPSAIACTDVAGNVQGGVPFGVVFYVPPGTPGGLRIVQ